MHRFAVSFLALFAIALLTLAPPARAQAPIEGNAIAVTAPDGIYILDPTGQIREKLDFVAGDPLPCWLPNGNLLVADGFGNLVEINPLTGAIIREIDLGQPVTGMTMGAAGLLYVTTPVALVVLDLSQKAGEEIVDVREIAGGDQAPCWLPNGHIMVAVIPPPFTDSFEGLREIDPASGATIREIPFEGINDFVRDPVSGNLYVVTDKGLFIQELHITGASVFLGPVDGQPLVALWLPDSSLGVIVEGLDGIQVIDPETAELLRTIAKEIKDPTGFAVAPFHLETEIIGQLVEPPGGDMDPFPFPLEPLASSAALDIRENATLIYGPNTGMIAILLDPAGIIAPMFDAPIVSLTGFDIPINAERGVHGAQVPPSTSAAPLASMAGIAEGDHDPLFNYTVREIEASLHLAGLGGIFQGKIKAKNKAKPR